MMTEELGRTFGELGVGCCARDLGEEEIILHRVQHNKNTARHVQIYRCVAKQCQARLDSSKLQN